MTMHMTSQGYLIISPGGHRRYPHSILASSTPI